MLRLLLGLVLLAAQALATARGSGSGDPAGTRPASPLWATLDGRVYDVSLRVAELITASRGPAACDRPRSDLQQTTFQIRFVAGASRAPAAALAFTGVDSATRLVPGAPQRVTLGGDRLTFDALTVDQGYIGYTLSGGYVTVAGAGADAAGQFTLTGATLRWQFGDAGADFSCDFIVSGRGLLDTSPPVPFFGRSCQGDTGRDIPCTLLPDASLAVWFSEPVRLSDVAERVTATDEQGNSLRLAPVMDGGAAGYALSFRAAWPAGERVLIHVAPGTRDLAGNASGVAAEQSFKVVSVPDGPDNPGFERGDLRGYTALLLREFLQPPPGRSDPALLAARLPDEAGAQATVAQTYAGIIPAEGRYMAVLGDGASCAAGEVALVTRVHVPDGATTLTVRFNLVSVSVTAVREDALLAVSLRGLAGPALLLAEAAAPSPTTALPDGRRQSGWQQLQWPIGDLAGQDAYLTIHARPGVVSGLPPTCSPGVLLLDGIGFA